MRLAALVALIAVLVTAAVALFGDDSAPAPAAVVDGPIGDEGWFHSNCNFSHRGRDDPILFPGQADASHSHDFIGSRSTGPSSTNGSLRADPGSSCERDDEEKNPSLALVDRSAYWTPTALVDGRPLAPEDGVTAGYAVGPRTSTSIQPFPEDLKMIAGNSTGGDPRLGKAIVYRVRCGSGPPVAPGSPTTAPTCATPDLRMEVNFPDCSNGEADSADHQSHMAYSQPAADGNGRWVCPSTHPIPVPQLNLKYRFATKGGPDFALGSGDVSTVHADFMNGWNEERLAQLIRDCLHANEYCGGTNSPVPDH